MAFPINGNTADTAAEQAFNLAKNMRQVAVTLIAQCDAGALNCVDAAQTFMHNQLSTGKTKLVALAAVPGIYDALVRMKPNKFADATAAQAAYAAVQTAVNTMIVYMEANIPMDDAVVTRRATIQIVSNDGSGTLTARTITNAAQRAAFKAQLEAFRDAFEV